MNTLLNITESTLIALHSIILIAKSNDKLNVKQIAKQIHASENHIAKVMQRLVKLDFVDSTRGPAGGFLITDIGKNLTLLDIYEAMEGKITESICLLKNINCPFNECILGDLNKKFIKEFIDTLKHKKIINMI